MNRKTPQATSKGPPVRRTNKTETESKTEPRSRSSTPTRKDINGPTENTS